MEELNREFETFYKEYYEKLLRAAFRLTGNKEDAQDVIQEAYLNAFKAFAQFDHNSSFGTWIYRIMLNCSYRYMKKRDKLPIQIFTAESGISETEFWNSIKSNESVEDSAMVEDIRETCIQLFLDCIPQKQRIAFTLRILMQLPINEVAEIMSLSQSAVKINVYRAKQHLKNNMEGECSFINPKSPCQCANWVKYLIDTGKIDNIPRNNSVKKWSPADLTLISSEMDFLSKIIRLYDNQPEHTSCDEFIVRIKEIISQKTLKILT
ncbi:sigma-70 family RNA polymerase sigma factor [Desulfosporosinus sp. OT]|uniref:RNA polymerase sigma factor n=1 Tax=Desulfosporosinus sp. OT TaxID=913865 RepID=UPI000223AA2C|nr:sigma-70 family RNA polymerase sigma factor [Desulfosporosinus sp. OT]EGW40470.1 RNA polymerase sigma factor, sigma-70 family protein [Desulfosporosinus sp. OT]